MDFEIKVDGFHPCVMMHYRSQVTDIQEHSHDFLMVYYVVSGSTTITIDKKDYFVKQSDLVLIDPYKTHCHGKSDAVFFYLGFSDFQLAGREKNQLGLAEPVITPVKYSREIYQCYRSIIETLEAKEPCWDLMSNVLSIEFMVWILKEISPSSSGKIKDYFQLKMYDKESVVNMMTTFFKENYMQKISVEEIAKSTYLSTTYLTKIFKEIINDTPINYLIMVRLEKAKELLEEGQLSVQEISKQIGYDDPYYFSKLFKKKYQVSPSEYRKQKRA